MTLRCLLLLTLGFVTVSANAATTFTLPPPDVDLVGYVRTTRARQEDTLLDIGRRYSIGYEEIVHANPDVDRWLPGDGTPIVLPTRYILPDAPREGIVLNVSEMRLYYFPEPKSGKLPEVITYPVSIGRMDWKTPLGKTRIVQKQKDPPWYPPASIKAEHAANGEILPDMVPGGTPENPLGSRAMRLSQRSYLIHGTNKPYGIGMRVTHGCIRMYPEDIEQLFPLTPVGTPVYIVDQPIKIGQLAGTWFIEAHAPLEETNLPTQATFERAMELINEKIGLSVFIDTQAVRSAIEQINGLPVPISGRQFTKRRSD